MAIPDERLYEYAIVRYMPRPHRGEFLNIGLLMMNKRRKWLKGCIHIDEERLKTLNPNADITTLKNQCKLFERKDVPEASLPVEEKYRWLAAEKSASIRISPSHPGLLNISANIPEPNISELMEEEFQRLFNELIK